MKKVLLLVILLSAASAVFAQQQQLLSYEDIRYLLHNNLARADTFLIAKGYSLQNTNGNQKYHQYQLALPAQVKSTVSVRADGKKIFIEVTTNDIEQYNLLKNSISQYRTTSTMAADVEAYVVKDLGNIYITINDTAPYDPLKKDYDIQIVPDKNITAWN